MNTVEIGRLDVGHDMRTLQDDELDAVSGGWSWGMSQTGTTYLLTTAFAGDGLGAAHSG